MSKIKAKDFESVESLISWLNKKYYEPRLVWTSSARFNVTLVFFHGKKAYHDFLNQAPFPKLCLSEILSPSESDLNCSQARKWLDEALLDSNEGPQIILQSLNIYGFVHNTTINSDEVLTHYYRLITRGKLYCPMLDYYTKYKDF